MRKKNQTLTGLEALDNLRDYGEWLPSLEMGIIRKELKALEIIKEKRVNIEWLLDTESVEEYNENLFDVYEELTQEEYDLLKEVLL